jgi:hypothetical protein
VVADKQEQLRLLKAPTFDARQTVILEEPLDGPSPGEMGTTGRGFRGTVDILDSEVDGYRFQVEASSPAVLVVSQNYYPGWEAVAQGASLPVFPADLTLTGIALPEGKYEVLFTFEPLSFRIGAWISAVGTVVLLGLVVRSFRVVGE